MGFQLLANVRVGLPKGLWVMVPARVSHRGELMGLSHRNTTVIFFLATFFFLFSVSCQLD